MTNNRTTISVGLVGAIVVVILTVVPRVVQEFFRRNREEAEQRQQQEVRQPPLNAETISQPIADVKEREQFRENVNVGLEVIRKIQAAKTKQKMPPAVETPAPSAP